MAEENDSAAAATTTSGSIADKLPSSDTKGKEGSATFGEKSGFFAEILAYGALGDAADDLVRALPAPPAGGAQIVLTGGIELSAQAALWEVVRARLDDAGGRLEDLLEAYPETYAVGAPAGTAGREAVLAGIGAAVGAIPGLLGVAADIGAFFRSNLTVTGQAITLSERALIAEVAAALTAKKWQVVHPTFNLAKGTLATKLDTLLTLRRAVVARKRKLSDGARPKLVELARHRREVTKLEERLTKLQTATTPNPGELAKVEAALEIAKDEVARLEPTESHWQEIAAELDTAVTACDELVKAVTQGAEGKPSALEVVAAVDLVKKHDGVEVLYVEIASQGGEIHAREGAFRTSLTYLGGSVVSWFLADADGTVKRSGATRKVRAKAMKPKEIADKVVSETDTY